MKWGAPPSYLTYAEAAGRLGVSRNHLRQIVFQRKWTVYRPGPRCSVLPAECVEEELKRRGRRPSAKGSLPMQPNEERWLSILELRGLLRLSPKACRNWVKRHVPAEAIQRQGRSLRIAGWGINAALSECVWLPHLHQPRGFQGDSKRRPPNLSNRDSRGKFVSNHRDERPPRRKGFVHPTRRRYIKQTD